MANVDPKDAELGLYQKFRVERCDGSSLPGGRHHDCEYFVLDLDHDPHALGALQGYLASLKAAGQYPKLQDDLRTQIAAIRLRRFA
jgi:hypothetical protein